MVGPAPDGAGESLFKTVPKVNTSVKGKEVHFLAEKGNKKGFSSREPCWIVYAFDQPFTCRSVTISTAWNNYQSNRLKLEVSDDGINFRQQGELGTPQPDM